MKKVWLVIKSWTRYGTVGVWRSTDPARNRDRVYVLRWEPGFFGPALIARWGRVENGGGQRRVWWPATIKAALRLERRVIRIREAHGYTCTPGAAWPAEGAAAGDT